MNEYRSIEFKGWHTEIPKREAAKRQLTEHDLLCILILAESDDKGRWVEFKCEDKMHAIKVANHIETFGFDVEIKAREDRVYARRKTAQWS